MFPRGAAFPEGFSSIIKKRHTILRCIRDFFDQRGYIEVETPLRIRCPGFDPYIDAIPAGTGFYLAPSPELQMKRLLSLGINRIYQITRAFRANEHGPHHNSEFTMLEWYRTETDYLGILDETEELIAYLINAVDGAALSDYLPLPRMTVSDVYRKLTGWDPCATWDEERYFRDWVEKIDLWLQQQRGLFLLDFPAPLASLARISRHDPNRCERFELFIDGLEICNAFTELTDPAEHVRRFQSAQDKRRMMGKEMYPADTGFMEFIESREMPQAGGIALGIDRLMMALFGISDIEMVLAFPVSRL
ncbi:MAG: EF-P lysine aminoacylase GenX [Desulfobacterota bacterium]|nr:EF-P lysine aminoacylase GenX [Thermodesulfobacteriota bacterium]